MKKKYRTGIAALMAAAGIASCSDDGSSTETATIELRVVSFTPGEDNVVVPGAEVCVWGTTDCETAGADGVVFLEVDVGSDSVFRITADGFGPVLTPQVAVDSTPSPRDVSVLSEELMVLLAASLNTPYPTEGTGVVAITLLGEPRDLDTAIPGVTMTLLGAQAPQYYLDDNGFPDTELSETTTLGTGGYYELSPGTYEVELASLPDNCTRFAGWAGSTNSSIRFPVEAGSFSNTLVVCDPADAE